MRRAAGQGIRLLPYLLIGLYSRVKRMDAAPPGVVAELEALVRAIADMYDEATRSAPP